MGSRVWYCTREEVMDAFDIKEAAPRFSQVDDAIKSASDDIDGWLNRHKHGLAPTSATRYFNWPSRDYSEGYRIWFDENELVSATSFTAGSTLLAENTDYFLEPVNSGPPFTYAEINLAGPGAFDNNGTSQRAIQITGTWGINNDQIPAGALDGSIDGSVTLINVSDSFTVGVGDILTIGLERIQVTDKLPLTTGATLSAPLSALNSDRTIAGVSAGFTVGETLLVGSERMRIVDNDGTDLTVIRGYDGSVLSSHLATDPILAYRQLKVVRGVLGTAGAAHTDASAITKWDVPALVRDLAKAEAITRLEQEWSAYGARVYSDEAERDSSGTEVVAGRGLTDLRKSCARRYKRKFRVRAV